MMTPPFSISITADSADSMRPGISSVGTPRFSRPKATSSLTTVATIWLSGFWKIMPACWRMSQVLSSSLVSMPQTVTTPSVGRYRALSSLARVDLPEPLCPSTATNSPGAIWQLTWERAGSSASS